jgi:hypothetical protein
MEPPERHLDARAAAAGPGRDAELHLERLGVSGVEPAGLVEDALDLRGREAGAQVRRRRIALDRG